MFLKIQGGLEKIFKDVPLLINIEKIVCIDTYEKCIYLEGMGNVRIYVEDFTPLLAAISLFNIKTKKIEKTDKPVYNRVKMCFEGIGPMLLEKWKESYPGVNIEDEIKKAESWLISNPKKMKYNITRFLNNWFMKKQDSFKGDCSSFVTTANRCIEALSKFGNNSPDQAREYIGDLGVVAIKKAFTTWKNFCLVTTDKNEGYHKSLLINAMKTLNV